MMSGEVRWCEMGEEKSWWEMTCGCVRCCSDGEGRSGRRKERDKKGGKFSEIYTSLNLLRALRHESK